MAEFRKPARAITDRAARYRANALRPPGPRVCAFCGKSRNVRDVCHIDGHEKNSDPLNLTYGCRSCNVTIGNVMRRAGLGTLTRQYNPMNPGATTLAQYVTAVMSLKGEGGMPLREAVELVHDTPHTARSRFAKEIWRKRKRGRNPGRFKHEDVSAVPAGWKVRTVKHGDHRVRVAFPPGRRVKGAGRLVSVLHPSGENPTCSLRSSNPAELLIMGANPPRSRRNEPLSEYELRELTQLWHTARIPLGGTASRYERLKWAAKEWEKTHPGQRLKAYKALEHSTHGYGNPGILDEIRFGDRVTIETPHGSKLTGRAVMLGPHGWVLNLGGQHGTPGIATDQNIIKVKKSKNPPRTTMVFFDESIHKYTAAKYHPTYGNMHATGETAAEAKKNLRARIREAERTGTWRNPSNNPFSEANVQRMIEIFHGFRDSGMAMREAVAQTLTQYHASDLDRQEFKRRVSRRGFGLTSLDNPSTAHLTREQKNYWLGQKDYWENVEGAIEEKAKRYAWEDLYKKWPELRRHTGSSNPRVEVVHASNPPVEEIVEGFTGAPAEWLDVYNEPHMQAGRYAQLGPLIALYIKPAGGGQVIRIGAPEQRREDWETYWGGDPPVIVTNTTGRQIFFVGGNQDISAMLESFGLQGAGTGVVELGKCRRIDYEGRKEHVADPDEDQWKHDHGEEDGELPTVLFDTRHKRLLYQGGNYRIDGAWIRN